MPNGNRKNWFKKVFGGSNTPDPDKVAYENKLAQISPSIKQAAKAPAYKESMALGLKEVDRFVKNKDYVQATTRLEALGKQAQLALRPQVTIGKKDAEELAAIGEELSNVVGKAQSDRIGLLGPSLDQERDNILTEIENQNKVAAQNGLDALKNRLADARVRKPKLEKMLQQVLSSAQHYQVALPPSLEVSLDAVNGLLASGGYGQAEQLIGTLHREVQRGTNAAMDARNFREYAIRHKLGLPGEIDTLRDNITTPLSKGDMDSAQLAADAFVNFNQDRELLIEDLKESLAEAADWANKLKLKLLPPADFNTDEQAIRNLLTQSDVLGAKQALEVLRAAFKPAAEIYRLRNLLDRLVTEEATEKRIDSKSLGDWEKEAKKFLDAGDIKQAQSAIKKISDAIITFNSKLSVEKQQEIASARIAKKIAGRLKKAQELAQSSPDNTVQTLIEDLKALKPPFDQNSEAKAAEIYAQIMLKTGNGKLEQISGSANGVFALKTPDKVDIDGTKYKQFFKPVSSESRQPGFPKGGGASREVIGKKLGDKMSRMMGLEMNVAETNLIELPVEVLPDSLKDKGNALGSIQHNVHQKGDAPQKTLDKLTNDERKELFEKIPKKKAQAQQVFDLVFANLDRHGGNYFVKGEGEEAELSGIDNGMGLPSIDGLLQRSESFGLHALKDMPSNSEKFDPEVLKAIEQLDEEELAKTAKASFEEMKKQFPDSEATKDDKLNDEHLNLMKSSIKFLKKAAKELTVDELFNAYLVNLQDVYGIKNDENDKLTEEERFDKAIQAAKDRGTALKELNANASEIEAALNKHGWSKKVNVKRGPIIMPVLMKYYPKQVVSIWKNGGPKGPMPLKVPAPAEKPLDQYDHKEIEAFAKAFDKDVAKVKEDEMAYWTEYQKLGGDVRAQRLGATLSASPFFGIISWRYDYLCELIELNKEFAKVPV